MKNWGIRSRVLLVAIVPSVILASLMYAYFISTRFADLDESLRNRGRAVARQLAAASEYGVFAGNRELLQNLSTAALREPDVTAVAIRDNAGQVLARGRNGDSADTDAERTISLEEAIKRNPIALEDFYGDAPAGFGPAELGRVTLEISRQSLYEKKRALLATSMLLLLAVLAGSVVLGGYMSRGVTRPVRRIANAVDAISRGEMTARIEPEGDRALRRLAVGLNEMANELQMAQQEMRQRIDEATRQLKEKKEEAETANLAKSRFLAAASHDLRQPMHALGLFVAELMQRAKSQEMRHLANQISASAEALENLLDALLDISKLDAHAVKPEISAFAMQPLLDRMQADFGQPARDKGLRLRCRPSALWVQSDRTLIERILINLVSNAVRYTRSGSVLVACRLRGDQVRIEIHDSGVGIPTDDHDTIFQEFTQLHNPERDRTKGIGLGLAIVQRSAQLLGHRLRLRSEPGRGSIFSLEVPRAQPQPCAGPSLPAIDLDQVLRGKLIVAIDDDALALASIDSLLRSWHCRVVAGPNENVALDDLADLEEAPQLVICDYRLADNRNGIEVVEHLRDLFGVPLPGVIITGDTVADLGESARSHHCHLLHKPVRPAKLRALVQQLLKP